MRIQAVSITSCIDTYLCTPESREGMQFCSPSMNSVSVFRLLTVPLAQRLRDCLNLVSDSGAIRLSHVWRSAIRYGVFPKSFSSLIEESSCLNIPDLRADCYTYWSSKYLRTVSNRGRCHIQVFEFISECAGGYAIAFLFTGFVRFPRSSFHIQQSIQR